METNRKRRHLATGGDISILHLATLAVACGGNTLMSNPIATIYIYIYMIFFQLLIVHLLILCNFAQLLPKLTGKKVHVPELQ